MDINQVIENNACESVTSNADEVENNELTLITLRYIYQSNLCHVWQTGFCKKINAGGRWERAWTKYKTIGIPAELCPTAIFDCTEIDLAYL